MLETPLGLEPVRERVGQLLRGPERPTAVITNSDLTAHAVYLAARDFGLRIGPDLSVVGHDDHPTSELLDPPLTSIASDRRAIGAAMFARLTGSTDGDHVERVRLIPRASSAAPS